MDAIRKWLPIVFAVFFVVFLLTLPYFTGSGWMMGRGGIGWGMMGGGYPMMGFGWLMMGAVFLAPLVLTGLVAAWVISMQSASHSGTEPPAAEIKCPHCGQTVRKEWVVCPHCGKKP